MKKHKRKEESQKPHISPWTRIRDEKSGKNYFFNTASLKSAWKTPKDQWYKAKLVKVGKKQINRVFYFNPYEHKTSYSRPQFYDSALEEFEEPMTTLTKSKHTSDEVFVPCLEETTGKVYWYNISTGVRLWSKPSWSKHSFCYENQENDNNELIEASKQIQIEYQKLSNRIEKHAKRLEKLKLELARKQKKQKQLQEKMNKSVRRKHHHMSMNIMASAVKAAFSQVGSGGEQIGSTMLFASKDFRPIVSFLKSIDLFLYLSEQQFQFLAAAVKPIQFSVGEKIVSKGDDAETLLLIESGIVGVYTDVKTAEYLQLEKLPMEDTENDFGQKINQLYSGDYLGAREIMSVTKFEHDHVALCETKMFLLTKANFDKIVLNDNSGTQGFAKLDFTHFSKLKEQHSTFGAKPKSSKRKKSKKVGYNLSKDALMHIKDTLIIAHEIQSKADKTELSSLTNYITACSNLIALKVSNKKAKSLSKALLKLTLAFSPFLNFEDVLTRTLHTLREIFKTHEVNLFKVADIGNSSQGAIALLEDCQVKRNEVVGLNDGLVATAINTNQLVAATNKGYKEYIKDEAMMKFYNEVNAVMVCPICTENDEVIGAVRIMRKEINASFTDEEQRILIALGEQVSTVFESHLFKKNLMNELMPLKSFRQPFNFTFMKFVGARFGNSSSATRPKEVLFRFSLYNGDQQLCMPWFGQTKNQQSMITFAKLDTTIHLDIAYRDIPRTACLVVEVFSADLFTQDYYLKKAVKMNMELRKLLSQFLPTEEDLLSTTSSKQEKLLFAKALSQVTQSHMKAVTEKSKQEFMDAIFRDASPKGWTALGLFNFEQILCVGKHNINLIDLSAFDPKDLLLNPALDARTSDKGSIVELVVNTPRLSKSKSKKSDVSNKDYSVIYTDHDMTYTASDRKDFELQRKKNKLDVKTMPQNANPKGLQKFLYADPLKKLNQSEKALIYNNKDLLVHEPHALPRFVESVNYAKRNSVIELYDYLNSWETPDPLVALNLLGPTVTDYKVRSLAVTGLASMSDENLSTYIVQLVQCLRLERFLDNALACFLIAKSIENPWLVGVSFFWAVTTEIRKLLDEANGTPINAKLILRYRVYKAIYMKHCRNRLELGHQRFVNRKLIECHQSVVAYKDVKEKEGFLRQELAKIKFPQRFRLPINNRTWCTGIKLEGCSVKSSKKLPFYLTFTTDALEDDLEVIFKVGDDLRQDQLTLTAFSVVDSIWKQHRMDMKLSIYRVVATSNVTGFIEVVKNSDTIAKIQVGEKKYKQKMFGQIRAAYAATRKERMKELFKNDEENIKTNFIPSCAGYCVLTYILGIGDRHNDNMMMTKDLKLFHIDFGHFLGNYKKAFKIIPRETAPFVLTQQMVSLMQAVKQFGEFKLQFVKAFQVLREPKNGNLLITLFKLMVSSDITELKEEKDILWIRHKLMVDTPDNDAVNEMEALIQSASLKYSTYFNHLTHIVKHHKNY